MRTANLLLAIIAAVIVISFLAVWFTPSIQDFMASNTFWNGASRFTEDYQASEIDSFSEFPQDAQKSVLVSIPYLAYTPEDLSMIRQFVSAGNTLVLLDDFGYGNAVLEALGVQARFGQAPLLDPLFCLKNPALPRITDFTSAVKEKGVLAVDLNHATFLDNIEASQILASSSANSYADLNNNGSPDKNEPQGPFAVAAEIAVGKGTLRLISDPSLFINSMSDQNNNALFVSYLISPTSPLNTTIPLAGGDNIAGGPSGRQGDQGGSNSSLYFDRSHLSKAPLDSAKLDLEAVQRALFNPYALVGLLVVIFILVTCYTFRKGDILGKY